MDLSTLLELKARIAASYDGFPSAINSMGDGVFSGRFSMTFESVERAGRTPRLSEILKAHTGSVKSIMKFNT